MELLKSKDNLSFQLGDVTFYIRSQMTVRDKFEMDMIGDYVNGKFSVRPADIYHKFVELFVCGWKGVTEDGKDVPYSYQTFMQRIPGNVADDWILRIGSHIATELKLLPQPDNETKKND